MSTPNTALQAVRLGLRMSQDDLARAIRDAGDRAGEPNDCSKRLVQRWESGQTASPRAIYVRALEYVTGQPITNLGFTADERYGVDRRELVGMGAGTTGMIPLADPNAPQGPLTGIWHSWYDYVSSGRDGQTFTGHHYVIVIQHGARLQVRSIAGSSDSPLMMDLTVNGQVVTGTWTEQTNPDGYYQGAVYHGAIQMLLEPTGRKMSGQWAGFGRDFEVNTGPWTLKLVSNSASKDAITQFSKRPVP